MTRASKDSDSAARMQHLRALAWSIIGGALGGMLGFAKFGLNGLVLGWAIATLIIFVLTVVLAGRIAAAFGSIYVSSGSSTRSRRGYSRAESLAVRGYVADAVVQYERCAARYPEDPEPLVRIARLQRDRLRDYENAASSFKRVLDLPQLDRATEGLIARELIELYTHKLAKPERALPVLAMLADRQNDTPQGAWARTSMTEIKQQLRDLP